MKFEGIYTPVITPYEQNGSIDRDTFCAMIEFLVGSGVQGTINGGSTGEYYALSMDERIELAKLAKQVIAKRTALIIGTGAIRLPDSLLMAETAAKIGADANATGSDLRALYAGFPAKGAVLAAVLASKGVPGIPGVFEAPHGIMSAYFGDRYERQKIIAGLGKDFTGGLRLYKRRPAVGTAHSRMYATISLVKENNVQPNDIAEIKVYVGDYHQLMCDPIDVRRLPKTPVDAKFSLPYLVAVSAVHRELELKHFAAEALTDSEVLAVAQKIGLFRTAHST